jgi:hypothetical protein
MFKLFGDRRFRSGVVGVLLLALHLTLVGNTLLWAAETATGGGEALQFKPQIYAILGQDWTVEVATAPEVDEVVLFVRKLAELGDFAEFPLDRVAPGKFSATFELTQYEDFNWERLEYYLEARQAGSVVGRTDSYVLTFVEQQQIAPPVVDASPEITENEFEQLVKGVPLWKRWWFWAGATVVVGGAVFLTQGESKGKEYGTPTLANFRSYIDAGNAQFPAGEEHGTTFYIPLPGECWLHFTAQVSEGKPPYKYTWTITTFEVGPDTWDYATVTQTGSTDGPEISSETVHYEIKSYGQTNKPLRIKLEVTDAQGKAAQPLVVNIRFFAL